MRSSPASRSAERRPKCEAAQLFTIPIHPRGQQLRLRLGAGGGINPDFGAPEWRVVVTIETFNRDVGRAGSR